MILYATNTGGAVAHQLTFHSNIVTGEAVFPRCHYLTAAVDSFVGSGEDVTGFK